MILSNICVWESVDWLRPRLPEQIPVAEEITLIRFAQSQLISEQGGVGPSTPKLQNYFIMRMRWKRRQGDKRKSSHEKNYIQWLKVGFSLWGVVREELACYHSVKTKYDEICWLSIISISNEWITSPSNNIFTFYSNVTEIEFNPTTQLYNNFSIYYIYSGLTD